MSKIKLKEFTEEFGNIGINPDVDENDKPFNRISMWVQNPITKKICVMNGTKQIAE